MPEERTIQLPNPQKSAQSYVMSQAFYDKLKRADLGYFMTPNAQDFDITVTGETKEFSLKASGRGATMKHIINRMQVNSDGNVNVFESDYWSMFFQNGLLRWTWSSADSLEPEPDVPEGTPIFYSVNLTSF